MTVGIIDWMLDLHMRAFRVNLDSLVEGVERGQRLAAANCSYFGARGIFRDRGPDVARELLKTGRYDQNVFQPSFWGEQSAE